MTAFVTQRLLQAIPVVLGVSVLVFLVLHLIPGDPVELMTRDSAGLSPEIKNQLRETLGFNDPIFVQYGRFIFNAIQGDLGRSVVSNRPVVDIVASSAWPTVQLAGVAMLLGIVFGVGLGVIAALKAGTFWDVGAMAVALVGISMPSFFLALLLIFIFAIGLGWLPITSTPGLAGLVLPAVAMALFSVGINARLIRSSMLEVMQDEYIVTARAKGLPRRVVILRHALRNALLPAVTMIGLQVGIFLSGSVIVETVFARVGIGKTLVDAIVLKDIPVVQGVLLVTATAYVVAQVLVDLGYAWLDPRIRTS